MRRIFIIYLFFITIHFTKADNINLPFEVIINQASEIVMGEIIEVDSLTYQFKITKKISGNLEKEIITVSKFKDWQCDPRRSYKVGQKSILFLSFINGLYYTINGGNGEIPLNDFNKVYVSDYKKMTFEELQSGHINLDKYVDIEIFSEAIKRFNQCIDFGLATYQLGYVSFPMKYKIKCKSLFQKNLKKNEFYLWLISRLSNYEEIK